MGRMRIWGTAGSITVAGVLLAACTAGPPLAPSPTTAPQLSASPSMAPADLKVPPESREELARATVTVSPAEALETNVIIPPSVHTVAVDFSCAGPASLGWAITDAAGAVAVGTSGQHCDGSPEHDVIEVGPGMNGGNLEITGDLGSTAAYAIVTPDNRKE